MPITRDEFIKRYPSVYHLANPGAWHSIQKNGLLSTSELLDRFGYGGEDRAAIESNRRPESVEIEHPGYGTVVIRDQGPLSETRLKKCLTGEATPTQWYEYLNRHVFFWPSLKRMRSFSAAYPEGFDQIKVDTCNLLERHLNKARLSHINSGAVLYEPQPRGLDLFKSFEEYPYHERLEAGLNPISELVIEQSVEDLAEFVIRVTRMTSDQSEVIYERDKSST